VPDEGVLPGPPGFELEIEPVVMAPAAHWLDDTTTENDTDAALSVVLNVVPVKIIV